MTSDAVAAMQLSRTGQLVQNNVSYFHMFRKKLCNAAFSSFKCVKVAIKQIYIVKAIWKFNVSTNRFKFAERRADPQMNKIKGDAGFIRFSKQDCHSGMFSLRNEFASSSASFVAEMKSPETNKTLSEILSEMTFRFKESKNVRQRYF